MDSLTEEAYIPSCPIDLGHLSLMSHLSQNYMTTGGHCVQTDHCLVIHWTHIELDWPHTPWRGLSTLDTGPQSVFTADHSGGI